MLEHSLCVEVGDEEGDVIAFDGFPSQNDEVLGSHHHESHEFVAQDFLDFVGLFYRDGDSAKEIFTE